MKNEELRRVQGTYSDHHDLNEAVEKLHANGYINEEMCLVVKRGHDAYSNLEAYPLEIFEVDIENRSKGFFEKLKDLVLVEEEKEEEPTNLRNLGLEEIEVKRFLPALEEGAVLLLVDSEAPRTPQHYYR